MNTVIEQLQHFKKVGLPELDQVALLDRMDTKYVFTVSQLPEFLELISEHYYVLEINGSRTFKYESLYFDTEDFVLYNHHYCGRSNRYKVRYRNYVESGLSFFEIKFKNNKGRTIKSRIRHIPGDAIMGDAQALLKEKTPLDGSSLEAKLWVNYTRITLVSTDFKERLTLDLDLTFKSADTSRTIDNLVIAEVKQGKTGQSVFTRIMKKHHIRKGSISKYCFGVASLFNHIRVNNFKSQIIYLNRILYASPAGH